MRAVVQRVSEAQVSIAGNVHARIGRGLLVLLAVATGDTAEEAAWLAGKLARMRIFPNEEGVMDLDVRQVGGELLVISQFTLLAATAKGNRPGYSGAARPEEALPMYRHFCTLLQELAGTTVHQGVFGADMKVGLVNDGPVTIIVDSRLRT
jgi:D-aminoacyl-tRNA deacylase